MKPKAIAPAYAHAARPPSRQSRAHSKAARPASAATSATSQARGSRKRAARSAAMSTAAVATLTASPPEVRPGKLTSLGDFGPLGLLHLLARAAEAALAAAVRIDRLIQRRGVEVRPKLVGEIELGVRELPQQEVADPLLAAGADEQIRLRRVAHREIRGEVLFANFIFQIIIFYKKIQRLHDVPTAAVVGGDGKRQPAIGGGERLAPLDQFPDLRVVAARVADHLQAHPVSIQFFDFA